MRARQQAGELRSDDQLADPGEERQHLQPRAGAYAAEQLGPRFGFAYSTTPKTVIRGGYGISYTQYNRAGGENNLTYNGPNVVNATDQQLRLRRQPTAAPATRRTRRPASARRSRVMRSDLTSPSYFNPSKVTSRYIPKNFETGYVQSYFLGVQRQLPWGVVMDVAYVGNKGTHLQVLADYNQAVPCLNAAPKTCGNLCSRGGRSQPSAISRSHTVVTRQLQLAAVQAGEARRQRPLSAELVYLGPHLRSCLRSPRDEQRRQLARQLRQPKQRLWSVRLRPAAEQHTVDRL